MIGVICRVHEKESVQEFFELFKTPWGFYQETKSYDVIISTKDDVDHLIANLIFIFENKKNRFDDQLGITAKSWKSSKIIVHNQKYFPIYGNILVFKGKANKVVTIKETSEAVGFEILKNNKRIIRLGFDLFKEVNYLISSGQPAEFSHIPTLDIHISMLRHLIVKSGISLIEIPPVPVGYDFITCLTHDVDYISLRKCKFDHTLLGFIYRAFIVSFKEFVQNKTSWRTFSRNWLALLKLPGVYLGFVKDYFDQIDHYIQIEKKIPSTFFLIPYKNHSGYIGNEPASSKRASRYAAAEFKPQIKKLMANDCEIGLHGIDAWSDDKKGREEYRQISEIIGKPDIGTRMHWLYFNSESPETLEKVGFHYDTTCGYNEAIGFKAGTSQAFCPPGAKKLIELPLHIQDTALFFSKRMNLSEKKAKEKIFEIIGHTQKTGGALTINWHLRSLGPERLWDDFYKDLLTQLKQLHVWFARAGDAVKWFNKRRLINFEKVKTDCDRMIIEYRGYQADELPGLVVRIHKPDQLDAYMDVSLDANQNHLSIPLNNV